MNLEKESFSFFYKEMDEHLSEDRNFSNIIERKFEYRRENSSLDKVKFVQQAAECAWSFEIPIYLL
jgi:hypothetical protein